MGGGPPAHTPPRRGAPPPPRRGGRRAGPPALRVAARRRPAHHQAGDAELDAAIMDGSGPRAGAVAAVTHVKNPIELARLVMERSPHVLLVAEGAEDFALEQGVKLVPREYFRTAARQQQLEEARAAQHG